MNKLKPFQVISTRFQVSRESAKYFLIQVQKSFKTERPPHQLILDFMTGQNFEALPKPYQVAALMNQHGVWTHPMNSEPLLPRGEEDLYDE